MLRLNCLAHAQVNADALPKNKALVWPLFILLSTAHCITAWHCALHPTDMDRAGSGSFLLSPASAKSKPLRHLGSVHIDCETTSLGSPRWDSEDDADIPVHSPNTVHSPNIKRCCYLEPMSELLRNPTTYPPSFSPISPSPCPSEGQLRPTPAALCHHPPSSSLWGGGAIKAERVCRLVLPGVPTGSPFEQGILHSWMDRWVGCPPVGLGARRVGSKNCERWAAC